MLKHSTGDIVVVAQLWQGDIFLKCVLRCVESSYMCKCVEFFFFFQAEDGIRDER